MSPDAVTRILDEIQHDVGDPATPTQGDPPTAWILAGPPASGKTTLAEHLQQEAPTKPLHVENDALRPHIARTLTESSPRFTQEETQATYQLAHRICALALANRHPIIHDATNLTQPRRAPLLEAARRHEATPRLVILETPRTVRRRRAQRNAGTRQAHAALGQRTPTALDPVPTLHVDGTKPPNEVAQALLETPPSANALAATRATRDLAED